MRWIGSMILCLTCFFLSAQNVEFRASLDTDKVAVNNTFIVTYYTNAAISDIQEPDFKDFAVISGPSRYSSKNIINGVVNQSTEYKFTLLANDEGTFTIPPAIIILKGKKIKSNSLTIQVVKGSELGSIGEGGKTFLQMETNDTVAYLGQRIVLKYIMYTKEDVASLNLLNQDDFNGFYDVTEESPKGYTLVKVGDEDYYSRVLLTYFLYPEQTGVFELDPFSLKVAKPIKNGRVSVFGRRETKSEIITSNKIKITVKKLPSGAPESFSGAVGKFMMNANISKDQYTTNDAILMEMEIKGTGNQLYWTAPSQPSIEHIEYYDPKVTNEQWVKSQWGSASYKSIDYMMVGKEEGTYVIQPEFSYFDVDSLEYITLKSRSFPIKITKGKSVEIETGLDEDLPSFENAEKDYKWIWIGLPILLLGLGGFFLMRKDKPKEEVIIDHEEERKKRAKALAIKALSGAKNHIDNENEQEFYAEISLAINKYLGDKFDILSSDRTPEYVERVLRDYKVEDHKITEYTEIMKKIELAVYARMGASDMDKTYERSIDLIQSMED